MIKVRSLKSRAVENAGNGTPTIAFHTGAICAGHALPLFRPHGNLPPISAFQFFSFSAFQVSGFILHPSVVSFQRFSAFQRFSVFSLHPSGL